MTAEGGSSSPIDRKARIREYKKEPRPAGIYQVRNTATGVVMVGATTNLAGRLNRHRFQLKAGLHPNAELQADWNDLGPDAFELTVLDTLEPRAEPDYDPREDLALLLALWIEKLRASGVPLYGEPAHDV